jgi:hypothetical protein
MARGRLAQDRRCTSLLMGCAGRGFAVVTERPDLTAQGYRRSPGLTAVGPPSDISCLHVNVSFSRRRPPCRRKRAFDLNGACKSAAKIRKQRREDIADGHPNCGILATPEKSARGACGWFRGGESGMFSHIMIGSNDMVRLNCPFGSYFYLDKVSTR